MKMMKLDDYEKELLQLEKDGVLDGRAPNAREQRKLQEAARNTLNKDKRINIRISARDLDALQRRANRFGMPYQTLISSVLHRYVSGEFERSPKN
ncbi:MAG: hypothetical protein CMO74_07845 [Verrucomicrobiales bacterium]|nr:hypothetical protein [Verrucomicrobiales bacterium]